MPRPRKYIQGLDATALAEAHGLSVALLLRRLRTWDQADLSVLTRPALSKAEAGSLGGQRRRLRK